VKIPVRTIGQVLAGVVVGAAGLFGVSMATAGAFPPGAAKANETEPAQAHPKAGVMYPMRERIVNLADPGIYRYLKASIVLEVFDPENPTGHASGEHKKGKEELPKDLRTKSAPMEDRINAILSAQTAQELMAPAAKQQLKEEIRNALNDLLHEERIMAVYFTDFIIQ
jgi:flagellar FliL protein